MMQTYYMKNKTIEELDACFKDFVIPEGVMKSKGKLNISLAPELHVRLKKQAIERNITLNNYVAYLLDLITDKIDEQDKHDDK